MPTDHIITLTDADLELLEQIRRQQGLEDVEQAAEWLAKRAVRRGAQRMTGRGRALHLAGGKQ